MYVLYAIRHTQSLCSFVPLFLRVCPLSFTLVKSTLQIRLFMQNEPNFRKSQMNVNDDIKKDYENETLGGLGKTNPKRTQNEPNLSLRRLWRSRIKANFTSAQRPAASGKELPAENQRVSSSNSLLLSDCLSFCRASSSICLTLSFVKLSSSPICIKVFFFFFMGEPVSPK